MCALPPFRAGHNFFVNCGVLRKPEKALALPVKVGGGGGKSSCACGRREWSTLVETGSVCVCAAGRDRGLQKSKTLQEVGKARARGAERGENRGGGFAFQSLNSAEGARAKEPGEGVAKGIFCSVTFIAALQGEKQSRPNFVPSLRRGKTFPSQPPPKTNRCLLKTPPKVLCLSSPPACSHFSLDPKMATFPIFTFANSSLSPCVPPSLTVLDVSFQKGISPPPCKMSKMTAGGWWEAMCLEQNRGNAGGGGAQVPVSFGTKRTLSRHLSLRPRQRDGEKLFVCALLAFRLLLSGGAEGPFFCGAGARG